MVIFYPRPEEIRIDNRSEFKKEFTNLWTNMEINKREEII